MKTAVTALVVLLFAGLYCFAQTKRPIMVEDYFALKDVSDPHLSPDGKWVAYVISQADQKKDQTLSNIYMIAAGGGGAAVQMTFNGGEEHPRWSPDNKYLAFLSERDDKESQVYFLNRAGGEAYPVTSVEQGVEDFEWSPDSKRLLLVITDADPDHRGKDEEKAAAPIVINRLLFKWDGTGYRKELYKHLYVFDIASRQMKQITSGPYDDADPITGSYDSPPRWSPDGKQIVFVSNRTSEPDANTNTDIFVVSADGGEPRKITTHEGPDETPSWSADGKSIVYVTSLEPQYLWYDQLDIAVVPASGGAPRIITGDVDRNAWDPVYGPDGRIYFQLEDNGTQRVVSVPAQGGAIREATAEKIVRQFEIGSGGAIVIQAARADLPDEVFLTTRGKTTQITHTNEEWLKTVDVGATESIHFAGKDGTPVSGFVLKPPGFDRAKKYPAIVWAHGGPNQQETGEFYFRPAFLAAQGYVVIHIDYRGSTGHGKKFQQEIWKDWGNKEIDDLLAGLDHVISLGYVDANKIGMGGHSYGAILTNYMMVKSDRFKAFITDAGESNHLMNYGVDQYLLDWEAEVGKPWENPQRYIEMSPYFHLNKAKTPTLIVCGQEDWNVPLINAEQLYLSLRRLGVDTTLLVYPEQPHEFWRPSYIKHRYQRYAAWFAKYLH
jgi:dipeptidyl aminopeptidase/acylaminoacyl peptidase